MDVVSSEHIYDLIVIGAGPHGLAILARLFEPRPSSLYTDAESAQLSFLRRYVRSGTAHKHDLAHLKILVIDKAGDQWMTQWHKLFRVFDIKHLRSPMFFHPDPSDLDSLLAYSNGKGCDCDSVEITGVVGKEQSKHKLKKKKRCQSIGTDFNERERQDYFNPSTKTFSEFCSRIVDRYALHGMIKQDTVVDIQYGPIHERHIGQAPNHFALKLMGQSQKLYTKALVLAPGMGGCPNLVSQLTHAPRQDAWCHSADLSNMSFPPSHLLQNKASAILVIGGGLTSAQIADLALRRGISKVYIIMRSHMKIKHFDLALDWLGKYGNILKMQFYQSDFHDRAKIVLEARNGGSITPFFAKVLKQYQKSKQLEIMTESEIEEAIWTGTSWSVMLRSRTNKVEPFEAIRLSNIDYIVSATGTRPAFSDLPFMQTLQKEFPVDTSCGLPHLNEDLEARDDLPLFVASGYAALQLGPGAFNLSGSREGAERIVNRLETLFASPVTESATKVPDRECLAANLCNYFSMLSVT